MVPEDLELPSDLRADILVSRMKLRLLVLESIEVAEGERLLLEVELNGQRSSKYTRSGARDHLHELLRSERDPRDPLPEVREQGVPAESKVRTTQNIFLVTRRLCRLSPLVLLGLRHHCRN